jgi:2-amino-4-hydroxy-6-hydroxymethyldihydropteridine diphosphokinase
LNLPLAVVRIQELGDLSAVSRVYENPAVGGDPQANFLNTAALVQVEHSSELIREALRRIEADLGRVRSEDKYAARTIDLDLAMLGDRVEPEPPLPDPEIEHMAHLAVPLAELSPDFIHPHSGETLQAIAERVERPEPFEPRPDVGRAIQELLQDSKDWRASHSAVDPTNDPSDA